ncbi:unnamed protein product [Cochlearia groenlandica]
MANYGSIPTSTHASPEADIESTTPPNKPVNFTRRPWRVMLDFHSMTLPHDMSSRIKTNTNYFRANYRDVVLILILIVILINLANHLISLVVFVFLIILCFFLYFRHDEPVELFRNNHKMLDQIVKFGLVFITVGLLLLTPHAPDNIDVAFLVGVAVVLIHAVVRKTDDLFFDEEEEAAMVIETSYWKRDSFYIYLMVSTLILSNKHYG